MSQSICFIGGGNMATSLIGGLLANGHSADRITACDPNETQRERLSNDYAIATSADSLAAVAQADAVVLAVKPQIMRVVCEPLASGLAHKPVIISVAAGVRCSDLDQWLGGEQSIVRCMPNTPALYGVGAAGLYATEQVKPAQRELAAYIAGAVGIVEWVEREQQIDAVTALSGSGPAYGFLLLEAMQSAAESLGLPPQTARNLATQTLLGAATMAREDDRDAGTLREAVTSKGGTTAAALNVFQAAGFQALVAEAMQAACTRADELANATGDA